VIRRSRRERHFQQIGAGCRRAGGVGIAATLIILVASVAPASAAHPRAAGAEAATADVVVAKLRDLPLPMRQLSQGTTSAKAASPPLPAIELRRQRIYDELHALGPASVPALARALRDPDPQMRRDVAVALDVVGGGWWHFPDGNSKLDLRPALPALLAALQDSDPGVRAWAAQDISDMGAAAAAAVPSLRAMLHRPDTESRGTACRALGEMGSAAHGALPDLRRALNDSSPEVRQAARDAIASIDRAAPSP
jgi:vesicle coat complex subunit